MARVIHFELPAENTERAMAFYSQVFGWEFHKWDGPMEYWLVKTGPEEAFGISGGLAAHDPELPKAPINVIDIEDIDESIMVQENRTVKRALLRNLESQNRHHEKAT